MVFGIAGFEASEHQAGGVIIRLVDLHHLEAALQRGITFEVLLVFGPGGGGDGAQFAARQGGLQQVGCIRAPCLVTRANDGVCFINKQQNWGGRLLYGVDDVFQALFKFALNPSPRLQQAQVKGVQTHRLEGFRYVAFGDTQCQAFNQCGFPHTRLTHQNRVVLATAGQDVHHLADFGITAKYRVDFTFFRFGGDVKGEFIQRILQRRGQLTFFQFCTHRTANKPDLTAVALRRFRFLLHVRAFVRLCIQQRAQTFQLAPGQRQQWPQPVTANQFRFINQRHQQMYTTDVFFIVQGSQHPGFLHQFLNICGQLRAAAYRTRLIIQPAE